MILVAHQLTDTELARRSSGAFQQAFSVVDSNPLVPSFLREKYQFFYGDLLTRLKVNFAILDYNYTRLNKFIKLWSYERVHVFNLRPDEISVMQDNEYPLALEFFLQFDSMCTPRFPSFLHSFIRMMIRILL